MRKRINLGWRCTHCEHGFAFGEESANRVAQHIKSKHPVRWRAGNWSMLPIRKYDADFYDPRRELK